MANNAKSIETSYIGKETLKADPDVLFKAVAITTAAITSAEVDVGQLLGGNEIVIEANAAMTLPATEVLTFEFQTAEESGGTFATYRTLTLTGETGGSVFAADDVLFRYIPDTGLDGRIPSQVVLTPDTTSLASSVNGYIKLNS